MTCFHTESYNIKVDLVYAACTQDETMACRKCIAIGQGTIFYCNTFPLNSALSSDVQEKRSCFGKYDSYKEILVLIQWRAHYYVCMCYSRIDAHDRLAILIATQYLCNVCTTISSVITSAITGTPRLQDTVWATKQAADERDRSLYAGI